MQLDFDRSSPLLTWGGREGEEGEVGRGGGRERERVSNMMDQ